MRDREPAHWRRDAGGRVCFCSNHGSVVNAMKACYASERWRKPPSAGAPPVRHVYPARSPKAMPSRCSLLKGLRPATSAGTIRPPLLQPPLKIPDAVGCFREDILSRYHAAADPVFILLVQHIGAWQTHPSAAPFSARTSPWCRPAPSRRAPKMPCKCWGNPSCSNIHVLYVIPPNVSFPEASRKPGCWLRATVTRPLLSDQKPKNPPFSANRRTGHPSGFPHGIIAAFQGCGQFWQRRCPENIGALNLHSSTKCQGRQPLKHRCQRSGSCRTSRRCCRGFRSRPTAARVP